MFGQVLPVLNGGPAKRVRPDSNARRRDGVEVQGGCELGAVGGAVVETGHLVGGLLVGLAANLRGGGHQGVGAVGDPLRGIGVGRATRRGVVLEPTVARWIVGRGHDDAVSDLLRVLTVVTNDSAGDCGGRGVLVFSFREDSDSIGHQHLDGGAPGRQGQRMGILADEQGAAHSLHCPILHDCLCRGGDVEIVESGIEAGAAMSRGAENNLLIGVAGVGGQVIVGRKDGVDVDEIGF